MLTVIIDQTAVREVKKNQRTPGEITKVRLELLLLRNALIGTSTLGQNLQLSRRNSRIETTENKRANEP